MPFEGLPAEGPAEEVEINPAAKRPKGWPEVIGKPGWGPRKRGLFTILSFSISASFNLFSFARRFWNQILTWVSVKLRDEENSARSAIERYCFVLNFLSRASSCWVVKGVLGFRLLLCFLRVHFMLGRRGPSPASEKRSSKNVTNWKPFHEEKKLRRTNVKILTENRRRRKRSWLSWSHPTEEWMMIMIERRDHGMAIQVQRPWMTWMQSRVHLRKRCKRLQMRMTIQMTCLSLDQMKSIVGSIRRDDWHAIFAGVTSFIFRSAHVVIFDFDVSIVVIEVCVIAFSLRSVVSLVSLHWRSCIMGLHVLFFIFWGRDGSFFPCQQRVNGKLERIGSVTLESRSCGHRCFGIKFQGRKSNTWHFWRRLRSLLALLFEGEITLWVNEILIFLERKRTRSTRRRRRNWVDRRTSRVNSSTEHLWTCESKRTESTNFYCGQHKKDLCHVHFIFYCCINLFSSSSLHGMTLFASSLHVRVSRM